MLVKKLYRSVHCGDWNKELKRYDEIIVRDYVGYFIFGIIPIYLKMLDKKEKYFGSEFMTCGIYEKYKNQI